MCSSINHSLLKIAKDDTEAITVFARDFRKVCPLQVPGVDGGYSQAELEEIEGLVEGQCAEIGEVAQEWHGLLEQLQEQQAQSLKSQEEFHVKYEKVAHDLAMSEGLGRE